jgi:hypothetical protein
MIEQVVYRQETAKWYMIGQEFVTEGVVAYSYPEAFELLYKHPHVVAPLVRSHRRETVLA